MKVIYILSCLFSFSTVSEAKIFDSSLKKPLLHETNEKLYLLLSNAEKSALQGDIFKFYEQANKILPDIKNDLQKGMWLFIWLPQFPLLMTL